MTEPTELLTGAFATDYGALVVQVLARMKDRSSPGVGTPYSELLGASSIPSSSSRPTLNASSAFPSATMQSPMTSDSTSSTSTSSPSPGGGLIDQVFLRLCLSLSASHLVADATTNAAEEGIDKWLVGFTRLVDVVVALHMREDLELETLNVASKACSECWTAAGTWRGIERGREGVRAVATKLKKLLDENQKTYKGQVVYAP